MTHVEERIVAVHRSLRACALPYALGGALALAWCVRDARMTSEIDLNIFVGVDQLDRVVAALPPELSRPPEQPRLLARDAQARLRWGPTPIDIFGVNPEFHAGLASSVLPERFSGESIPFLSCPDLATFKAFFDRDRDWIDPGAMALAGSVDRHALEAAIVGFLGADDPLVPKTRALAGRARAT